MKRILSFDEKTNEEFVPKEGKVYSYKGKDVIVNQINKSTGRVEVSRDLVKGTNPFFVEFDELFSNREQQQNVEDTSTFDSYKYKS